MAAVRYLTARLAQQVSQRGSPSVISELNILDLLR